MFPHGCAVRMELCSSAMLATVCRTDTVLSNVCGLRGDGSSPQSRNQLRAPEYIGSLFGSSPESTSRDVTICMCCPCPSLAGHPLLGKG